MTPSMLSATNVTFHAKIIMTTAPAKANITETKSTTMEVKPTTKTTVIIIARTKLIAETILSKG